MYDLNLDSIIYLTYAVRDKQIINSVVFTIVYYLNSRDIKAKFTDPEHKTLNFKNKKRVSQLFFYP